MNITLTCSVKPENLLNSQQETYAEFDSEQTIADLGQAIMDNGHNVYIIRANGQTEERLKQSKPKTDLVFNVAEGLVGFDREAYIPRICENLGIPHTAAGSQALIDTLDKARTKIFLTKYGIPTPQSQVLCTGDEPLTNQQYPILLKPTLEGSSKGILNENLVHDETTLRTIARKLISKYKQPFLAEEFLTGREFTISVIGSQKLQVLPIVEITFDHLPPDVHHMDSYEAKWLYDNPSANLDPLICPANVTPSLEKLLQQTAVESFTALNCRDWARIDIRLNNQGIPNVLEINALPGFMKDPHENSRLPRAAYAAGWSYEYLIGQVIESARQRYGI